MVKRCRHCRKRFTTNRSKVVYCSRQCVVDHKLKKIGKPLKCKHCGKTYYYTRSNRNNKYCSRECGVQARLLKLENSPKKIYICPVCKKEYTKYEKSKNYHSKTCGSLECVTYTKKHKRPNTEYMKNWHKKRSQTIDGYAHTNRFRDLGGMTSEDFYLDLPVDESIIFDEMFSDYDMTGNW